MYTCRAWFGVCVVACVVGLLFVRVLLQVGVGCGSLWLCGFEFVGMVRHVWFRLLCIGVCLGWCVVGGWLYVRWRVVVGVRSVRSCPAVVVFRPCAVAAAALRVNVCMPICMCCASVGRGADLCAVPSCGLCIGVRRVRT